MENSNILLSSTEEEHRENVNEPDDPKALLSVLKIQPMIINPVSKGFRGGQ